MIIGLVCCFIVYCVIVLSPALRDIFHTRMARYSLFVLKVPLNTNQPGSILSVESSQNVESKTKNVKSKTEKCGVQNSIWSVDSQENH